MNILEKMMCRMMTSRLCYTDDGSGGAGGGSGGGAPPPPDPAAGGGAPPPAGGSGAPPAAGGDGKPPAAPAGDGKTPPAGGETPPADQDWRTRYSTVDGKVDDARLNTLKRYNSENDFVKAFFDGRTEIQKLLKAQPPGKDATPDQVLAWRRENGIPETAAGYFDKLPKGVVFGEADKPVILPYLEASLARGDKPEVVAQNLEIYHNANQQLIAHVTASDTEAAKTLETTLSQEWGGDYKPNMTIFTNFLDAAFPAELKQELMNARLGGDKSTPLMLSAPFIKAMVQIAREVNPANINTGSGGMDNVQTINDAIRDYEAGLNGKPKIGSNKWYKDEASQRNYRELVTRRDKLQGKKTG